jgi:hypothetical protein
MMAIINAESPTRSPQVDKLLLEVMTVAPYTLILIQTPRHGARVRSTLTQGIVELAGERLLAPHGLTD